MLPQLRHFLEHLERTVVPERHERVADLHVGALRWEAIDRLPLVMQYPLPDDLPFRPFPHGEIFDDPEKMLFNELVHAFGSSVACHDRIADDLPLTIRANFGIVVIASLFGARVEQIGDNPPWVRPFGSLDEFRAALDRDPLDFHQGWCPRVVRTYDFYREVLAEYPQLEGLTALVLPDLQGPLDTVELLRGGALFLDLHDDPALVSRALAAAARAQIGFARHLESFVRDGPRGFAHQHATAIRGSILIRNDTAVLLSPELYKTQVAPHDDAVLRALGGGGIHSCGKIHHHAEAFLKLPSVRCLDVGEPELNDLDALYARARERGTALTRLSVDEHELTSGRVLERFPTGVSLVHQAASFADAQRIAAAYREATHIRDRGGSRRRQGRNWKA